MLATEIAKAIDVIAQNCKEIAIVPELRSLAEEVRRLGHQLEDTTNRAEASEQRKPR